MRGSRLVVSVLIALAGAAPTSSAAGAAVPPFPVPPEWSSICDATRHAGSALVRGTNCRWISVDGYPRRFIVYVPRNPAFAIDRRWPLVFMFHGSSGDGEQFWKISGWKEKAEAEGFVAVFPTGLRYKVLDGGRNTKWNSFSLIDQIDPSIRLDGYPPSAPMPANDVKFTSRMVADIGAQLRLNARRLFVAGFSNGAEFAGRLAVDRSRLFAAAAWSSGGVEEVKDPPRDMPVMVGLGTLDDRVIDAFNEATDPDITEIPLPFADAAPIIGAVLGIQVDTFDLKPLVYTLNERPTSTTVVWETPKASHDDGQVLIFVLMAGVSHQYARPTNNPHHFSFATASWAFFKQHPMP